MTQIIFFSAIRRIRVPQQLPLQQSGSWSSTPL